MKTVLLLLAVLVAFEASAACRDPPNCITGFCHPGNWHTCCCPAGCLGFVLGGCYGSGSKTMDVNGVMHYTIYDANNKKLEQETLIIDETSVASQEQVDNLIALYGNQTLYMDAHIDIYGSNPKMPSVHKSWRHFKIN